MSDTQRIAEKIARLLESEQQGGDFASVFASIEKINYRLDKLEGTLAGSSSANRASQLTHPSAERFAVIEAVADQIIQGLNKEKACTFEPNGKPCDHCSMCSSRGF